MWDTSLTITHQYKLPKTVNKYLPSAIAFLPSYSIVFAPNYRNMKTAENLPANIQLYLSHWQESTLNKRRKQWILQANNSRNTSTTLCPPPSLSTRSVVSGSSLVSLESLRKNNPLLDIPADRIKSLLISTRLHTTLSKASNHYAKQLTFGD